MDSRHARWIALAVFALLIVGWVVAAVNLTGASAGRPGLPFHLSSRLAADYAADGGERISSLNISIVQDFLKDLGIAFGDDGDALIAGLDSPVPTATARNFEGDPPFTATAIPSQVPAEMEPPIATATDTPRPLPTKTAKPTEEEEEEEPEPTAGPGDAVDPILTGGSLSPAPGDLGSCTEVVSITDLYVVDPGPSSGIEWVKLKYKILGPGSKGYQRTEISLTSGGWEGSTWKAYYAGSITIDFDAGYAGLFSGGKAFIRPLWAASVNTPTPEPPTLTPTPEPPTATPVPPTATPEPTPYEVGLWAIVEDVAGNSKYIFLGNYTLPAVCGE